MVILHPHHMGQLLRLVTSITTTPRLTTVVTQGGKSVEERTLELVRITASGQDLFLDAQVSLSDKNAAQKCNIWYVTSH